MDFWFCIIWDLLKACWHQTSDLRAVLFFCQWFWLEGTTKVSVSLQPLSQIINKFIFGAFKKKNRIPHSKSVAMAVVSNFKSPHCLQSDWERKECWANSLSPCCQKQQVVRILRFFTLTDPWPKIPPASRAWPASLLLRSTSARLDSKVSVRCQCFDK